MIYNLIKKFFCFLFNYICHWEVKGKQNFPQQGPVLVLANHRSLWDPIAVAASLDRPVHFMAKEELFKVPLLGMLLKVVGTFPVKRQKSDRAALKTALQVLHNQEVLGMFPEGTRSNSYELLPFHSGAALIALRTGAPILPVACIGTKNIWEKGAFHSFKVIIGEVIYLNEHVIMDGTEIDQGTQLLQDTISAMLKSVEGN
ncbi:lysophospholipid acyltransferase family protein [Bacillota bacterium LX-D]|nr:lysophospholipid acyltransferase family protein [Bacillota bacterium LX-D]